MRAKLADLIHPEAVFMLHGFGHRLPLESRAFGKGVADHELMCGGLAMQEHYVSVARC
jgi:thiosulfate reductase/polysulfide reductase chain A